MGLQKLTELDGMFSGEDNCLFFTCPACNDGHSIRVSFYEGARVVWKKEGDTLDDLTVSPSINCTRSGCKFHGWIKNGVVSW